MPRVIAFALSGVLLGIPALAAEKPLPEPDQIVLELRTEGWVKTQSARVEVAIDAALKGKEFGTARHRIQEVLRGIIAGAEWRITRFYRTRDAAGLERWRVRAETRVPESSLRGLYERARAASQPGQQVRIAEIDFSPSLAEREGTVALLRVEMLRKAKEERDRLRKIFPERAYRIHLVDFSPARVLAQKRLNTLSRSAAARKRVAAATSAGLAVARKIVVRATVIFVTPSPAIRQPLR